MVTVIVAVPGVTAVTKPVVETLAINAASLVHSTVVLVALAGCMKALIVRDCPVSTVNSSSIMLTPVTAMFDVNGSGTVPP